MCYTSLENYIRIIQNQPIPLNDSSEWEGLHFNCYAYAMRLKTDLQNERLSINPGFIAGLDPDRPFNCKKPKDLLYMFKADCSVLGFSCTETTLADPIPPNGYLIAVYCQEGSGYHFVRRNKDGSWTMKCGWERNIETLPEGVIGGTLDGYEFYEFLGIYAVSKGG